MRIALAISLVLLFVGDSSATVVLRLANGPGIVATSGPEGEFALDSLGRVWDSEGWIRLPQFDPPVPVSQIAFWERYGFMTTNNERITYDHAYEVWRNDGPWPGASAGADVTDVPALRARTVPNPTARESELVFSLDSPTAVSVLLLDASGRVVRRLLDEHLPAGEHRIV